MGAVNEANLHHACQRAKSFGKTVHEKAAFYLHFLAATAHAFTEGNKRTALATCNNFLKKNGYSLEATDEELVGISLLVASGNFTLDETTAWLKTKAKKSKKQKGFD